MVQPTEPAQNFEAKFWHIPLSRDQITLREALDEMHRSGDRQKDIPLLVQLVENPKYQLPEGFEIFHGRVDLFTHDCLHILLGRGMLPKDESFVIGFTMGSTQNVDETEEKFYTWIAKNFYPDMYRFTEDDIVVFRNALRLGYVSSCQPLHTVDFKSMMDRRLCDIRHDVSLETDLLIAYYRIEKRRYPQSIESQRLLDGLEDTLIRT